MADELEKQTEGAETMAGTNTAAGQEEVIVGNVVDEETVLLANQVDPPTRRRGPHWILLAACWIVLIGFAGRGAYWLLQRPSEPTSDAEAITEIYLQQLEEIKSGERNTLLVDQGPVSDQELEAIRGMDGLKTIVLDEGMITDVGMEAISTVPELMHLRVRFSQISDAGLSHLVRAKKLRVINLPQAQISEAGVAQLGELPSLRQLRIGGDGLNDISLAVAKLEGLRAIHLINVPVTDAGLKAMATMPHLESLYLDSPQVTEAGWQWLFDNHPELHVHINQTHHDRDPQRHPHYTEDSTFAPAE